jgi:hypothetical protein
MILRQVPINALIGQVPGDSPEVPFEKVAHLAGSSCNVTMRHRAPLAVSRSRNGKFLRGIKRALRIPFLSFQSLRRPGCTAQLLCFHIAGEFAPHRLRQLSLFFSMRWQDF